VAKKILSQYFAILAIVVILVSPAYAQEIQVYIDREVKPAILNLISESEKEIDIEVYILTDQDVIKALQRAETRGVEVRIILDPNQPSNLKNVDQLKNRGVEVKWYPATKPAQMHRKCAMFDKKKVFLGSTNWTHNGFTKNCEINLLIDDPQTIAKIEEIFSRDWYYSYLGHYDKY
jgi:phosphatidylserine/phosphatidylglycerophosphate/cardiolipin synthase-like enzyme